jgi:hypothetical protein
MDNNRPLNEEFYKKLNETNEFLKHIYDNTTYADNYGSSMVIVIIVSLVVFTVFCYCYFMQKREEIYADWNNNRCKPQYIPIAGFIAAPEGQSISSYTNENFQYCLNAQATSLAGYTLQPVMYMVSALVSIVEAIENSIDSMRNMFANLRGNIAEFVKQIMGKILNMTTPLIRMFIALLDSLQKTQGVLATGVFTLLSVYYSLQSLIGSIFELLGNMLLVMIIIIAICWIVPFTIPMAIGMSATFVIIAAIISVLMVFYVLMFGIKAINIPKLPKHKCFDKNVPIHLEGNVVKPIHQVNAGDILENGTKITATMRLDATGVRMFNLNNIIVSESHIVKYGDKWIPVKKHPDAIEIQDYSEPYLYCFNTNSKEIILNDILFTDWDEIYDDTLLNVLDAIPNNIFEKDHKKQCANIHRYLDVGFNKETQIDLIGNTNKKIKDIQIGDTLVCGGKVYGIVEIETSELLENNKNNKNELSLGNKLYHLLTTENIFTSNGQIIPDYNDHIDKLYKK